MAATDPGAGGDEFYGPKRLMSGPPARREFWAPLTAMDEARRVWEESERLVGAHVAR
jgi:hypothetical protein